MTRPSGMAPDLVLDVGSSAVKAALVDASGGIETATERPLDPPSGSGGVSEQDAAAWWDAASDAARELASPAQAVRRVVLTGQMQTLTLNDAEGAPICATLSYGDVRAQDEAGELERILGTELLRSLTGNDVDAASLLAKALWLNRHETRVLKRAAGVSLGAADHLAGRLTGRVGSQAACDTTTASTTGLMELGARQPLPAAWFETLGLEAFHALLPQFVPGGARVGDVSASAASAWGVPAGTPVHIAPGDAGATTVGAGAGEPGAASLYLGTSGWLAFTRDVPGDPASGVFTLAHPREDRFIQVAPLLTAAGNLAWFERAVPNSASTTERIETALLRPPQSLVYLPYLAGERAPFRDPHVRGVFVGLTSETTQDDMLRAVLEGVAFAYRHAAEALGVLADGADATPWTVSGGGSRSEAWMQLLAATLGRPLMLLNDATWVGVRGAWHAARVAEGEASSWAIPADGMTVQPTKVPGLEARYRTFKDATEALRPVFKRAVVGA